VRPQSLSTAHCLIEPLESRQLCSVTVPNVIGHFNGGIFFNAGFNDVVDFRITTQQKSHFYGTFEQGDGSAGILVGTVNKRGIATFTFQSTNLISNYKGKAKAAVDDAGQSFYGQFITRLGNRSASGTFSTERVDILGEKSG
jgi:hypothetical protein